MNLRQDRLKGVPIFIPPLPEQQAIVTYLDRKTSQIDTLIELKTRKIELLREKRIALINHVVTKGLDPDVEMKIRGWSGSERFRLIGA
ncbi:MAG: restriction endonuclease subunit S [Saprospiraceae bacterium]|nr:restriction endonuclease subunit S [Saprospiraceae bacterium]